MKEKYALTSNNRIEKLEYSNDGKYLKGTDVTDEILGLAFQFLKTQFENQTPNGRFQAYGFGEEGLLSYLPKDVRVVRDRD